MAKLGIVLATYNEAGNLPVLVETLEELLASADFRVFVVDDNSPDGTSEVAKGLASRYGNISLITRPGKLGLGSALRDGMSAALADGCAYVLTMDADLSHAPQDVPRLLGL
ncbi:MAG: glycosyltransferase [Dehalococcoidia bacterium]|nr:glycosyltransferase [Dehalococcoidia bacterium]